MASLAPAFWLESKFCSLAMKTMWLLTASASESLCRLASMSCCSARAVSSLLVSWPLRSAITSAALTLLRTPISVLYSGSESSDTSSRFWIAASTWGALKRSVPIVSIPSWVAPSASSTVP